MAYNTKFNIKQVEISKKIAVDFYKRNENAFGISFLMGLLSCYEFNMGAFQLFETGEIANLDKTKMRIDSTVYCVNTWFSDEELDSIIENVHYVKQKHDSSRVFLEEKHQNQNSAHIETNICPFSKRGDFITQTQFEFVQYSFIGNLYICPFYWGFVGVNNVVLLHFARYWGFLMEQMGVDDEHNICLSLRHEYDIKKDEDNESLILHEIKYKLLVQQNILRKSMDDYEIEDILIANTIKVQKLHPQIAYALLEYYFWTHRIHTMNKMWYRMMSVMFAILIFIPCLRHFGQIQKIHKFYVQTKLKYKNIEDFFVSFLFNYIFIHFKI